MSKGIIAINKPRGWTSFDVVNKLKFMLKPDKVGHLGTLDPMATGVLLVTVGKATKLFDLMQEKTKTYEAEFTFGYSTDTLDACGVVDAETDKIPDILEIESLLPEFIGKIAQIPPKYSAKSVAGVRAYEMARKGKDFELNAKIVDIKSIEILSYNKPILKLRIVCGSGTYIRSIGRDIATKLNSLATMTSLNRVKIDRFSLELCHDIDGINKENVHDFIVPIKDVVNLPILNVSNMERDRLLNGLTQNIKENDGLYLLLDDFDSVAIVKIKNFIAKMSIFLA